MLVKKFTDQNRSSFLRCSASKDVYFKHVMACVISVKGLGKGEKDVCLIEPFYDTSGEVKKLYIFIV